MIPRHGTSDEVRELYQKHPYPSPVIGESLVRDVAALLRWLLRDADLAGWEVLDAGCGTGQRLLGLAAAYPRARFTGVDFSDASLEIASGLARKHGIGNVRFEPADLTALDLGRRFDLIVSTGVIHHLVSPERGVDGLRGHLKEEGTLLLWLYHALGESERLLDRELLRTLLGDDASDLGLGRRLLEALGLHLDARRYGDSNPAAGDACQSSLDADAFLHPVIRAYRFEEALDLCSACGLDWAAVNGINLALRDGGGEVRYASKLLDLAGVERRSLFTLDEGELFASEALLGRYRRLDARTKLRVIELRARPTGFTLLAGRKGSGGIFGERVQGNRIGLMSQAGGR